MPELDLNLFSFLCQACHELGLGCATSRTRIKIRDLEDPPPDISELLASVCSDPLPQRTQARTARWGRLGLNLGGQGCLPPVQNQDL